MTQPHPVARIHIPSDPGCPSQGAPDSRPQSTGEEIANTVSHGAGLLAALVSVPFLFGSAARRGGSTAAIGAGVFGATVVLLYLASTLYHALPGRRTKRIFRVIDHSAIFLLIAGTYTPFTLGVLRGGWGWTLLAAVWSLAAAGVTAKAVMGVRYPWLSTALYLAMGWLVVIAIQPLWLRLPISGWLWLAAGGLAYTAGVAFFAAERMPYGHFVWHLFVLAGTVCHFLAVLWYAV
jgi:hemolysin III